MVALANAKIVGRGGVDVQLGRDAGFSQCQVGDHAMFGRADDIGPAVDEKDRRRLFWNAQAASELVLVFVLQISGIYRNSEVGAATELIDLIDRLVRPL